MPIYLASLASSQRRGPQRDTIPTARPVGTRPLPAPPPPSNNEGTPRDHETTDDETEAAEAEAVVVVLPPPEEDVVLSDMSTSPEETPDTTPHEAPSGAIVPPPVLVHYSDTAVVYALPVDVSQDPNAVGNNPNNNNNNPTKQQLLASVLQVLTGEEEGDQGTVVTTPWDGIRESANDTTTTGGNRNNHHHNLNVPTGDTNDATPEDSHNATMGERIRPYIVMAFPVFLLAAIGYIAYGALVTSDDDDNAAELTHDATQDMTVP